MEQSPTCRWGVKSCKIKDGKEIVTLKTYVTRMAQWVRKYKQKYEIGPPSYGLKEPACLDRPDGMPGRRQAHSQGVQAVPNLWHWGCCRSLSTQPGTAVPTPCDGDQSCCQGSNGLPTHQSRPTLSAVAGL